MENLKELVSIINKRKISQIELLDKSLISRKDTLFAKFYDGIADGNIKSDEEAIAYLYGGKDESTNYRKLKSRFKSRLLNTLYFLDINNSSETDSSKKAYFDCVNRLYLSNILLRYAENRNASIQLIMETYPLAKKHNFYDILKEYAYKLLVYYGMVGDEKKYLEEYDAYQLYAKEYELEQKAQIIYSRVLMASTHPKKSKAEVIGEIQGYMEEIAQLQGQSKSLVIFFVYIRIQLFYYELLGDNNKINETCDIFLNQYNVYTTSILLENYLNTVYIYKLKSLFELRDYDTSLDLIKTILPQSKGVSYLAVREFEIKVLLNKKEFNRAKEVQQQINSNPAYKNTNPALKERWYIYNAYREFIENYTLDSSYKFSLSKFSNDIPITAQDKSGFNLSARIISILFYLGRNDIDNTMQQIDALKIYQSRHLKDAGNSRSVLFIKLLLTMEKKSFNIKELKNLKEYSLLSEEYNNNVVQESEIIFYDILWEMVLEILKRNQQK